ncbi:MAG TPA: mechanosensitive ion channel family protein [Candidatus Egerieimonas intestinavium]|uniref:Mechanosensitive ion channel family protein n=1 Tax=Candidatus Egerieimonas intestinavium TaxID=2840777 RepID=A0A9D1JFV2_9FIRM|nr:mechanosensitive ion channel family protein [Candidatus Egerieimonas intestinavium]
MEDKVADQVAELGLLEQKLQEFLPAAGSFLLKVILALICYFIGVRVIGWLVKHLKKSMARLRLEGAVISFAGSLAKMVLYVLLIMAILGNFGVEGTSVAALLASAGVGVSLALQGGLSNLAGGLILLWLKPFRTGDYIIEASGGREGTVKKIEMYYTTLATMDNREIVIPNSQLTNNPIINVTAQDERKLELLVNISYESDFRKAKEILQKLLDQEKRVNTDKEVQVFVSELADSWVVVGFRAWVKTADYWPVKWLMNEKIKEAFDEAGIELAFPQLDVHLRGETAEKSEK